jgi:hypothetical protein
MNHKQESVIKLMRILSETISGASNTFFTLTDLSSQGSLARYVNIEIGITSCSLNTLKQRADRYLDGGFPALDYARDKALSVLKAARLSAMQSSTQKKFTLKEKLAELKSEILHLNQDLFQYTVALNKSMEESRYFAKKTGDLSLIKLCEKQQSETLALLRYLRSRNG